jgi:hypothetical protein
MCRLLPSAMVVQEVHNPYAARSRDTSEGGRKMPAPAYWWHTKQNLSIKEGVQRALKIMAVVPAPAHKLPPGTMHEVSSDESWARLVASTFQVFVVCRSLGMQH